MMNAKRHCALLMQFKENGPQYRTYFGNRWLVSKAVLLIVTIAMLVQDQLALRMIGLIMVGYLIGIISANVRTYLLSKAKWEFQKDLIAWDKVEGHLREAGLKG